MESHCWLRTCRGILYSTHLYCQWEPQPKVLHLQLEGYGQQNLYTQHSILLSQQANPSRLEMRTVWISNLIIRIFFWEAEDASLKHLWVWRSPGFWASGLAIHGHIHILLQFQFQAKPAPFYPWEGARVWDGSYNELLVPRFSIQPVRTGPHCNSGNEQHQPFTMPKGSSHDLRRWLLSMIWNTAVDFNGSPTRKACLESGLGASFPFRVGGHTNLSKKWKNTCSKLKLSFKIMGVNLVVALFLRSIASKLAVILFPCCFPHVCCNKTAATPFNWSTDGHRVFSRMKQLHMDVSSCQPARLPAQLPTWDVTLLSTTLFEDGYPQSCRDYQPSPNGPQSQSRLTTREPGFCRTRKSTLTMPPDGTLDHNVTSGFPNHVPTPPILTE